MRSAFVCALLLATSAHAAEDYRVMKLEQDMRTLERHVQTLERQVLELQRRLQSADPGYEPPPRRESTAAETEQKWLNAAAWERVSEGMSELQVVELLGKPTALRPDARGRRALLYTLEIGTTGFLTGAVSFENGKVVEVQKPTLR
jgi:hypothetical protein